MVQGAVGAERAEGEREAHHLQDDRTQDAIAGLSQLANEAAVTNVGANRECTYKPLDKMKPDVNTTQLERMEKLNLNFNSCL